MGMPSAPPKPAQAPAAQAPAMKMPAEVLGAVPAAFREQLTAVLKQYLLVQRALGDDDGAASAQAVAQLALLAQQVKTEGLTPEQATFWRGAAARVAQLAVAYAKGKDIEEQRTVFVPLSAVLEDLVRASAPGVEIYRAFCPMAFGNNGAYWLQEGKAIHNPYEGKRMVQCGSLVEQLSGKNIAPTPAGAAAQKD